MATSGSEVNQKTTLAPSDATKSPPVIIDPSKLREKYEGPRLDNIFIKGFDGKTLTLQKIPLDMTAQDLVIYFANEKGHDPHEFRLLFAGKQLDVEPKSEKMTLLDYGITNVRTYENNIAPVLTCLDIGEHTSLRLSSSWWILDPFYVEWFALCQGDSRGRLTKDVTRFLVLRNEVSQLGCHGSCVHAAIKPGVLQNTDTPLSRISSDCQWLRYYDHTLCKLRVLEVALAFKVPLDSVSLYKQKLG